MASPVGFFGSGVVSFLTIFASHSIGLYILSVGQLQSWKERRMAFGWEIRPLSSAP